MIYLRFDAGSLVLGGLDKLWEERLAPWVVADPRIAAHRASAHHYAQILRLLHGNCSYDDQARAYATLELRERGRQPLRPYQSQALEAWQAAKRRGVIVLPTGSGKTYVAVKAILECRRSALILAPTIDLVQQWALDLELRLGCAIGRYGGGDRVLAEITVATYDSGILITPHHGNRFGLLICDECHHLPAGATAFCAEGNLAPFRLGLTATPERSDGGHQRLDELLGPIVHRSQITELEGRYLANYHVEVLEVPLDPDEAEDYQRHRATYLDFVRALGIRFDAPDGWQRFLSEAARAPGGREVLRAWREQRRIARGSRAKLRLVWQLLRDHHHERVIIFTDDNATAYAIGAQMLLPVLTHHSKPSERKAMLAAFRSGDWPVLVTSRVLNEGVDVPEAAVGIVVSGTGSVREHVQRLGRILRPGPDKVAQLYELISADTAEAHTSARRRNHIAFDGEMEMDFTPGDGQGMDEDGQP
ncbi:MAG: DEAD/DEAH box helicase [Planctomycetota bacterium]|nr:MAG: DEAD/DEAH box helicase [Planctomycetota bacterium]